MDPIFPPRPAHLRPRDCQVCFQLVEVGRRYHLRGGEGLTAPVLAFGLLQLRFGEAEAGSFLSRIQFDKYLTGFYRLAFAKIDACDDAAGTDGDLD